MDAHVNTLRAIVWSLVVANIVYKLVIAMIVHILILITTCGKRGAYLVLIQSCCQNQGKGDCLQGNPFESWKCYFLLDIHDYERIIKVITS